jgi:2-phosphosulfolactate phosphatase
MKRTIDVCLSPDLMHLYAVQDITVVVVDILRATSCMTTALAHSVDSIKPFAQLPDCLATKSDGYMTAGERDGKKVEGFDLGNSPFEYMNPLLKGQRIAFTTTNGTQAIAKASSAKDIVIASFLNLSAVVDYLRLSSNNILIVCSGWKGKVNLEDTVFAGALIDRLRNDFDYACDAPIMAHRLYTEARHDLKGFLQDSSHIKRLQGLNIERDIDFCLTEDQYNVVPVIRNNSITVLTP